MKTVTASSGKIILGRRGENNATQISFPVADWIEPYQSEGIFELIAQRSGDTDPYPVLIEVEENTVIWTVTSADTANVGNGLCELQYRVGDVLVKSQIWQTLVLTSLDEPGEPPRRMMAGLMIFWPWRTKQRKR